MKKILLKDFIFQSKIKEHNNIKNKLLREIEKDNPGNLKVDEIYFSDTISKLDWNYSSDCRREWVKVFLPYFFTIIKEFLTETSYNDIDLSGVWYQQYIKNDSHSWHIHAEQYTGVYYLEFPENSSKTELIHPYDKSTNFIDAQEGDIIIFPSHIIHRSPSNQSNRKTIISFNFSIGSDDCDEDLNFDLLYSEL
jgi:hypothetical protein